MFTGINDVPAASNTPSFGDTVFRVEDLAARGGAEGKLPQPV
jgi:hypothetical protein